MLVFVILFTVWSIYMTNYDTGTDQTFRCLPIHLSTSYAFLTYCSFHHEPSIPVPDTTQQKPNNTSSSPRLTYNSLFSILFWIVFINFKSQFPLFRFLHLHGVTNLSNKLNTCFAQDICKPVRTHFLSMHTTIFDLFQPCLWGHYSSVKVCKSYDTPLHCIVTTT